MNQHHVNLVLYVYLAAFFPVCAAAILYRFGIWRAPWLLCCQIGVAVAAKLQRIEDWFSALNWEAFFTFVNLTVLPMCGAGFVVWFAVVVIEAIAHGVFIQAVR